MAAKKPARKKPVRRDAPMLHIGASKDTIASAREVIASVLNAAHTDEETKREALRALQKLCAVDGTTITHCNFQA